MNPINHGVNHITHGSLAGQCAAVVFRLRVFKTLVVALISLPLMTIALPTDRQSPITIHSDSANIDHKKGVSVYQGNVIITQGTTRITGDIITIHTQDHTITKVEAQGDKERAYYEEQQSNERGTVQAWGKKIIYDVNDQHIHMIQNAQLSRNSDTFKGEKIDFNIERQTVNAIGAPKMGKDGRIQIVIQPQRQTNNNAP